MRATFTLSAPVRRSPRVMQVAGMMDVPIEAKATTSWDLELPIEQRDWSIGLVVGPSGSGKSSLAHEIWPQQIVDGHRWSPDAALLDDFPADMPIRNVVKLLTDVGLGSVPAWLRPHHTLSTGEAFRADIARALANAAVADPSGPDSGPVVVDEYTSVVDRQVAKIASHCVAKAVRKTRQHKTGPRFVAVTCHYDVADWLAPDWVMEMPAGVFSWRSVQPHPEIRLDVHPIDRAAWATFGRHHYLSSALHAGAACFGGFVDGTCVAFTSYLHFPHPKVRNIKLAHRTVVLPDWQGLGISGRMAELIGQRLYEQGYRYHRSIAHPAVIAYCARSPRWREITSRRTSLACTSRDRALRARMLSARTLAQRSFEYIPPASADRSESCASSA